MSFLRHFSSIYLSSSLIFFQMLKHVQISPLRNRSDSISLRSSTSFSSNSSCASSLCGSPEPSNEYELKASSRSSSYSSLNESVPQVRQTFCNFLQLCGNYHLHRKDPSLSLGLFVSSSFMCPTRRVGRVIVPLCCFQVNVKRSFRCSRQSKRDNAHREQLNALIWYA